MNMQLEFHLFINMTYYKCHIHFIKIQIHGSIIKKGIHKYLQSKF